MERDQKLRVAILGTRGIPASYGGFETFAEELAKRLAQRGHSVVVYGRRQFWSPRVDEQFSERITVKFSPTIYHKYLETPLAALTSFLATTKAQTDVVILCNAANSPFSWILSSRGIPLVTNVDGIERRRTKWNALGKLWYLLGERTAVAFSDSVIADAYSIAAYYWKRFGVTSECIAYGAAPDTPPTEDVLRQFNLESGNYILYVSRLEPENNALGVIRAYNQVQTEMPLVVVGDAPYAEEYKRQLRAEASSKVIFTGYQFGTAYRELRSHCYLYVQATEVGGTHPALVEALRYGNCVIANGVPEHFEVVGGCGEFYRRNDFDHLAEKMDLLLRDPQRARELGALAAERGETRYSWDEITTQYERLCYQVCDRRSRGG